MEKLGTLGQDLPQKESMGGAGTTETLVQPPMCLYSPCSAVWGPRDGSQGSRWTPSSEPQTRVCTGR